MRHATPKRRAPRAYLLLEVACVLAIMAVVMTTATSVYVSLLRSITKMRMGANLTSRAQAVTTYLGSEGAVIGGGELPAQLAFSVDDGGCAGTGSVPACDSGTDRLSWLEIDYDVPTAKAQTVTATTVGGNPGSGCTLTAAHTQRYAALLQGRSVALVKTGALSGCNIAITCIPFAESTCTDFTPYVGGALIVVHRKAFLQSHDELLLTFFGRPPTGTPSGAPDPLVVSRSIFDFQVAVGIMPLDPLDGITESSDGASDSWIFNGASEGLTTATRNRAVELAFDVVVGVPIHYGEPDTIVSARGTSITRSGMRLTKMRGRTALRNRAF